MFIVTLNIQYHHHSKILFMRTIRFLCFVAKKLKKWFPCEIAYCNLILILCLLNLFIFSLICDPTPVLMSFVHCFRLVIIAL